jgi:uncharacterized NAD(P)/FAD-binding protein YdhS
MLKVAIIGAGFSGTMTAIHLMRQLDVPVHIFLFDSKKEFSKGVAYATYSDKHLLNVTTSKMSAYPDLPDHFLDWVNSHKTYESIKRQLIAHAYLPRKLYGEYLSDIWSNGKKSNPNIHRLTELQTKVIDVKQLNQGFKLTDSQLSNIEVDKVILATGNESPGDISGINSSKLDNQSYFRNPWEKNCVTECDSSLPILILGNGLTMIDTVISLRENGFRNIIFSISPNGFNILPHRHPGLEYDDILHEIEATKTLYDLVKVTNRHIKKVRSLGISAEPVVNALRSRTPGIWRQLTDKEKAIFYSRIRHLWGVARHRLPLHLHDQIQNERIQGTLRVYAGNISGAEQVQEGVIVKYLNKKSGTHQKMFVSRIINCTGPTSDFEKSKNEMFRNLLHNQLIEQDALKLGINADANTYQVTVKGRPIKGLHAIGSLLRGVFWESTAVGELRLQAVNMSKYILRNSE